MIEEEQYIIIKKNKNARVALKRKKRNKELQINRHTEKLFKESKDLEDSISLSLVNEMCEVKNMFVKTFHNISCYFFNFHF